MTFIAYFCVFISVSLVVTVGVILFEIRRPVLLARAQIQPQSFAANSLASRMSVFEALRSLRFSAGKRSDFRCRVDGTSLSGYGVYNGSLLALKTVLTEELHRAELDEVGNVIIADDVQLIPGKTILMLPYSRNSDRNARDYGQKLRVFVSARQDDDGSVILTSRKLDECGDREDDWHFVTDIVGVAYANLSSNRLI